MHEWIELILSKRSDVLDRTVSPGLNPIPTGQYPPPKQTSTDTDQQVQPKPKKVRLLYPAM